MKYRVHRYPARFPVKLSVGGVGWQATVISISASGACVVTDQTLAVGQPVVLTYAGTRTRAKIKWAAGDNVGLMFDHGLPTREVDRIRHGMRGFGMSQGHSTGFTELR